MKNKINTIIKQIIQKYPHYLFYFLLVGIIIFQLLIFRYNIVLKYDPYSNLATYIIRSFVDAILLLLPYWLLPAKYRHYIWIIVILFSIWILSQMWYYRTYNDLMPFSSYLLYDNVSPILINSIIGSIHLIDCLIILPVCLLYFIYYTFLRTSIKKVVIKTKVKMVILSGIIMFSLFIYTINALSYYNHEKGRTVSSLFGKYITTTGYAYYFDLNGFVALCIYSFINTIIDNQKLTENEKKEIENFIMNTALNVSNLPINSKGKNLILIVVESLNSWVLNFKIDDIEITPNLNKLCKEDSVIVALHMQSQVKDGRSSDAHFMYNTGLLPIKNGATAVRYGNANYPSLAKALQSYNSIGIVCDDAKFWNQRVSYNSYGFNKLYDYNSMPKNENNNVTDKILFKESLNILKKEKQPFYAQLVTITMHQPYDKLTVPATKISHSPQYTQEIKNYLETVHFFDTAIGDFIDDLKRSNLFHNSVIAIISDHNELNKNILDGRKDSKYVDKEIAMIILNTNQTQRYNNVMGQIDVYPTLLDIMGCNDYYWKGLGHSIFQLTHPTSAVLWSGEIIGYQNSILIEKQKKAWEISNLIITKHYFK